MRSRAKILLNTNAPTPETLRLSNEAIVTDAIDKAIGTIRAAANVAKTAKETAETEAVNATGARERIMLELAGLANAGNWTDAMIDDGLTHAFNLHYSDYKLDADGNPDPVNGKFPSVGTVATLRSELKRATNPKIRAQLPAILKPWTEAYETDETVKARWHARHQMITAAMTAALGKPADKKGKGGTPSYVPSDVSAVQSWVKAHPRGKPGATTPTATANSDGSPLSPRQVARNAIEELIKNVRELSKQYGTPDCLTVVIEALDKCSGDKLVPNVSGVPTPVAGGPAAPIAPAKILQIAEPVEGAADLEDAMSGNDEIAALKRQIEVAELRAKLASLNGK